MNRTFPKLAALACAALVATGSCAQIPGRPGTHGGAPMPNPACKCPGTIVKNFPWKTARYAQRWANTVRCARGNCPGGRPCFKTVKIVPREGMVTATVRCGCRIDRRR